MWAHWLVKWLQQTLQAEIKPTADWKRPSLPWPTTHTANFLKRLAWLADSYTLLVDFVTNCSVNVLL